MNRNDAPQSDTSIRAAQAMLDTQTIRSALERNHYNRLATANELGIHKSTLFSIWHNRIAPVFDVARRVLVVEKAATGHWLNFL